MVKYMYSCEKISTIIMGVMIGIVIISMTALLSTNTSAESATATVTVGSACTLTATVNTAHTAEVPAGSSQTGIGSTTLNTICNDAGGYAIYAVGFTGNEYGNNKMSNGTNEFNTGTGTSASNWNMSLNQVTTGTYATTIDGGFGSYSNIPATYTKVAHRDSMTDPTTGSSINLTYGAYISNTQAPGEYVGKVKFTMVHPATEVPIQPQITQSGKLCYYPNANYYIGTMWCENISAGQTSIWLQADYLRNGYGFAGWNTKYDYTGEFYGPNEIIPLSEGQYRGAGGENDGLGLYAVWVKSEGSLQDSSKVSTLCGTNGVGGSIVTAPLNGIPNLDSVSALTDQRDNTTYAIAKLADGKCWMIENLRLDNTANLTISNTNNPLNDGTNVTLKHNYADSTTFSTLSSPNNSTFDTQTNPDGWCSTNEAACTDQSRIKETPTYNAYGNYYNWYSATAGRGTYDMTSGDVVGDLCPAGWRLPAGRSTGDFYALNTIINNGAYNSVTKYISFPYNFVFSGYAAGDGYGSYTDHGEYWTSTAGLTVPERETGGYYFYFYNYYSQYVSPGDSASSRYYGHTIRCIANN